MAALPPPQALNNLSDRQREVLEWVGDGKTIADIALVMGLKPATVEKHMRNARDALQVETTAQAVMKASLQKQLFVFGT
jgi:LuxR family transcriptional regulator